MNMVKELYQKVKEVATQSGEGEELKHREHFYKKEVVTSGICYEEVKSALKYHLDLVT